MRSLHVDTQTDPVTSTHFREWVRRRGIRRTAEQVTVHFTTVYAWLRGDKTPSEANMRKLARLAAKERVTLTHADFGYTIPPLT